MSDANQAESQHGHQTVGKQDFYAMYTGTVQSQPGVTAPIWATLANDFLTDDPDPPKDDPDLEENLKVPAGYTYFGQFVDHDLTFDTTSDLGGPRSGFTSERTPRFDLDCVYGAGPDASPFMYSDGVHLIALNEDLPRAGNDRAIIGDPRNDENSIVCQIQMAFLRYHNAVVDRIAMQTPGIKKGDLFKRAQQEVRWVYQRILVEDYLPRIVADTDIKAFNALRGAADSKAKTTKPGGYSLYPDSPAARSKIPLEFAAAAYRFGHSMVRTGYRLNSNTQKNIFSPSGADSLVGFGALPVAHLIDWSLFFPNPNASTPSQSVTPGMNDASNVITGKDRLQYAYKIDPMLVDPLAHLPLAIAGAGQPVSLGFRNLIRGRGFNLPSGQEMAAFAGLPVLGNAYLQVRDKKMAGPGLQTLKPIPKEFQDYTPLWLYILLEAGQSVVDWFGDKKARGASAGKAFTDGDLTAAAALTTTQLTGLGARIVLETFHGLLDSDADSFRNAAPSGWKPMIKNGECRMAHLVNVVLA